MFWLTPSSVYDDFPNESIFQTNDVGDIIQSQKKHAKKYDESNTKLRMNFSIIKLKTFTSKIQSIMCEITPSFHFEEVKA